MHFFVHLPSVQASIWYTYRPHELRRVVLEVQAGRTAPCPLALHPRVCGEGMLVAHGLLVRYEQGGTELVQHMMVIRGRSEIQKFTGRFDPSSYRIFTLRDLSKPPVKF